MTNLIYSQVEGVPGSRAIFISFNYPILITYLFIYYSDVRFYFFHIYFIFVYLFIYLFIYFIYLIIYFLFIYLFLIYLF